jgi:hypothetical protein
VEWVTRPERAWCAVSQTLEEQRSVRVTELRATEIRLDPLARRFIEEAAARGEINIIANEPNARDEAEYRDKEDEQRQHNHIPPGEPALFLEVTVRDPSEFEAVLEVRGEERHGYRILNVESPSIANAIAALLLYIRNTTGKLPHVYFNWTEGHPLLHVARFLVFGYGDIPPVTREILRRAEPDRDRRPAIHVG